MKTFLSIACLLFPLMSFSATCFKAIDAVSSRSQLPQEVCVDSYSVDRLTPGVPWRVDHEISIQSDFVNLKQLVGRFNETESGYSVDAEKVLVNEAGGSCERVYKSTLKFTVLTDKNAHALEDGLSISGIEKSNWDECHSKDEITVIRYQKM